VTENSPVTTHAIETSIDVRGGRYLFLKGGVVWFVTLTPPGRIQVLSGADLAAARELRGRAE
jgi:hypothetical protein